MSKFVQRIPVRTSEGFLILPIDNLVSAVAHGECLHLTTSDGEHHTMLYPLRDLEAKLDPSRFIRLSRNTLVNVAFVRHVVPRANGLLTIALSTGEELVASRLHGRLLRQSLLRL